MVLNLHDINKANKRVEAALNRRYEKNAELFISKQDTEDIKKWLQDGQFSFVYSKFKAEDIHPDIYFLTILRNSWLIQSIDEEQFKSYIRPILKQVRPSYAKNHLKDVADRKMDVPDLLCIELLKYYVQILTLEEVEKILVSKEVLGVVRLRLLVGKLLEEHIGSVEFISHFERYASQYPEIKGDNFFLKSLKIPETEQQKHAQVLVNWINEQAEHTQVRQYFINGLYFNYELLYEIALQQAKQHVAHKEKQKLWFKQIALAAKKLISPKTQEVRRKQITKEVIQLYDYFLQYAQQESPYYIRYCLKRVNNDYFRKQLNLYFNEQRVRQVPDQFQEDLRGALSGKDTGQITSVVQLVSELDKFSGNTRHMHYIAFQFVKLHPSQKDWAYLFDYFLYTSSRMKSFISTVLKVSKDDAGIWQSYFNAVDACKLDECYAWDVIIAHTPGNKVAKRYLEQKDYQKYSEIYRV